MAREIIWSLPAIEDIESIYSFIKRDSAYYANKFIDELIDRVTLLVEMPSIGRIVPELDINNLREIFVKQYRIVYQIEEEQIVVHGVVHMARDFNALWLKERE